MIQEILDPAFAIPTAVGDILVGLTAIPFAILLWKGYSWSKYAVVGVWNVLGNADLVNPITLGQITSSGPAISTIAKLSIGPFSYLASACSSSFTPDHTVSIERLRAKTRSDKSFK